MKIRKITIKKYKVFDDIVFDFTNAAGETLDNVVIAGINGSGKTTLLKLLAEIFSNAPKLFSCEQIGIEIDFLQEEKENILQNILQNNPKAFASPQNDFVETLIKKLSTKSTVVTLEYAREKKGDIFVLEKNDFILFKFYYHHLKKLKVCYFPAETKLYDDNNRLSSGEDIKTIESKIKEKDQGLVRTIDLGTHRNYVERSILQTINEQIYKNRDVPAGQIIKRETDKINAILKGVNLRTKLVDVNTEAPVFESFNQVNIPITDLSSGEKQVFYRAVYLNSLNLENSIIMVDEPELSLHPTWQSVINHLYMNVGTGNQVILATHSPQIISSVRPESLFIIHEDDVTKKLTVTNMGKAGKQSKGVEPNRVLEEIMGAPLRDAETQEAIDYIANHLDEKFEEPELMTKIDFLTEQLGVRDPFIIRLKHRLLLLNRKKKE